MTTIPDFEDSFESEEEFALELLKAETANTEPPLPGEIIPPPDITSDGRILNPESEPRDLVRTVVSARPMPLKSAGSASPPLARQIAGKKHVATKTSGRNTGIGSALQKQRK